MVVTIPPPTLSHDDMNTPAESFLEYRNLLFSIACNMLGQVETAQDIVQDAFLSWTQTDTLAVRQSAVTQALWFRIKMPLVLLVVLNGTVLARPATLRLKKLLLDLPENGDRQPSGSSTPAPASIGHLRNRRRAIYIFQLLLFVAIFVLSIFKF